MGLTELSIDELQDLSDEELRTVLAWADAEHAHLEHERLSIRDFLTDPHYLGQSNHWPAIVTEAERIVSRGATEIALAWGTGAGKSALGGALMCWHLYHVLPAIVDGSFFRQYKLSGDKPVFFFCLATRKEQVEQNLYRECRGRVERSPWFQQHFAHCPKARSETWFLHNGERLPICVKPLPAREEAVLSYDTFVAAVDEAAWFVESTGVLGDSAQEIWSRLHSRMLSRFLGAGLLMNLSAPKYDGDFSQRRCKEIEESDDPKLYASRKAIWETKPQYVDEIRSGRYTELTKPGTEYDVKVPNSLLPEFVRDNLLAWRDFGGVPCHALEPFDSAAADFLPACRVQHLPDVQTWRSAFVHIDLGLTQDACAMALAYPEDGKAIVGRVRVIPKESDTGAVRIEGVREQVAFWQQQGWNVQQVSADRFQSADLLQRIEYDGMATKVVSVDMDPERYNLLRSLIHEGRLSYHDCDEMQLFEKEYQSLMFVRGEKIDHPPKGSKDVADAIAGAVSEAMVQAGHERPLTDMVEF